MTVLGTAVVLRLVVGGAMAVAVAASDAAAEKERFGRILLGVQFRM